MSERRIDLTESQLRKLVGSVWKEAYGDGWSDGINKGGYSGSAEKAATQSLQEGFPYSISAEYLEKLIALEREHAK